MTKKSTKEKDVVNQILEQLDLHGMTQEELLGAGLRTEVGISIASSSGKDSFVHMHPRAIITVSILWSLGKSPCSSSVLHHPWYVIFPGDRTFPFSTRHHVIRVEIKLMNLPTKEKLVILGKFAEDSQ